MTRITDMRHDLKGQDYNVMSPVRRVFVRKRQRKVAQTPKSAGRLSLPRVTTHTSPMVKRSKVKVDRRINAVIENKPYLKSPLLQGA